MRHRALVFSNQEALITFCHDHVRAAQEAGVIIAGGGTFLRLYDQLGAEKATFFLSDERIVPYSAPESNFGAIWQRWLKRIPQSERPLLLPRLNNEPDPAALYEAALQEWASRSTFKLALLGVGADGHTASLFPGEGVGSKWVEYTTAPAPAFPNRMTLTPHFFSTVETVIFALIGPEKRKAATRILRDGEHLPPTRIAGAQETLYILDPEAAADLSPDLYERR